MPDFTNRGSSFGTVVRGSSQSFNPGGDDGPNWSTEAAQIKLGTLLNHIYRVDSLIGRGGMGEVYFGTNVNTDEQVAIKIILASLSNDPAVRALFRKEARTLVRLSHPALVQYRALAQDPELGVLYIVNEFVDGPSLADVLSQLHPTSEQMIALLRRLASGLAAAHEIGAVHRDISPDNILLPQGRVELAKIIDFGIAKDVNPAGRTQVTKTIVGTGFAGKFGYVAPEQFADSSQVGPWTDVYSLGLVILSVAAGQLLDMGNTFVDAIDKRRTIPDLALLPPILRPVVGHMLEPDRRKRFQSMDELLQALDAIAPSRTPTHPPTARVAEPVRPMADMVRPPLRPMPEPRMDIGSPQVPERQSRAAYLVGAGALIAVAIGAGAVWKLSSASGPMQPSPQVVQGPATPAPGPQKAAAPPAPSPLPPSPPAEQTASRFPEFNGRVVDEAGVLSPGAKQDLDKMLADQESRDGTQMVVVTLKSLRDSTFKNYSRLLRSYSGDKPNELLLIVYPPLNVARMEVGVGLKTKLTDTNAAKIVDQQILPKLRNREFDDAIKDGAEAVLQQLNPAPPQAFQLPVAQAAPTKPHPSRTAASEPRTHHKKKSSYADKVNLFNTLMKQREQQQNAGAQPGNPP